MHLIEARFFVKTTRTYHKDLLNLLMQYTDWVKPRPFQTDAGFLGKIYAAQIRGSDLEKAICTVATEIWSRRMTAHRHQVNNAVYDTLEPYMGKRNILYRLRMPDDTLWMARLRNPLIKKSAVVDEAERIANERMLLESEIATMIFVKRKTQIPVPEVYGYDTTYENLLGTPYTFIEYMPGKPYPFPFTEVGIAKEYELAKIHMQLTHFVWQLSEHPFNQIGQLHFASDDGIDVTVRPIIDRKDRKYGPFKDSQKFYRKQAKAVYEYEVLTNRALLKAGPSAGDSSESVESAALHVKAAAYAGAERFRHGPFILQHVDLHWQNLLLDDDCTVVGVIDWEWAQTVPVDSSQLLPFNFITKMLPLVPANVSRHKKISARFLQVLAEMGDASLERGIIDEIVSFQDSPQKQISQYLQCYNWPKVRRQHFERLQMLVQEIEADRSSNV